MLFTNMPFYLPFAVFLLIDCKSWCESAILPLDRVVQSKAIDLEGNHHQQSHSSSSRTNKVTTNGAFLLPPSPADLLKPDGFHFYAYNEKGDVITKQMTAEEIQALIAAGGAERISMELNQEPQKADEIFTSGKKVMDVVEKVQSVLKSALGKPGVSSSTGDSGAVAISTVPLQANQVWSNILPGILAGETELHMPLRETSNQQTESDASLTTVQIPNATPSTELIANTVADTVSIPSSLFPAQSSTNAVSNNKLDSPTGTDDAVSSESTSQYDQEISSMPSHTDFYETEHSATEKLQNESGSLHTPNPMTIPSPNSGTTTTTTTTTTTFVTLPVSEFQKGKEKEGALGNSESESDEESFGQTEKILLPVAVITTERLSISDEYYTLASTTTSPIANNRVEASLSKAPTPITQTETNSNLDTTMPAVISSTDTLTSQNDHSAITVAPAAAAAAAAAATDIFLGNPNPTVDSLETSSILDAGPTSTGTSAELKEVEEPWKIGTVGTSTSNYEATESPQLAVSPILPSSLPVVANSSGPQAEITAKPQGGTGEDAANSGDKEQSIISEIMPNIVVSLAKPIAGGQRDNSSESEKTNQPMTDNNAIPMSSPVNNTSQTSEMAIIEMNNNRVSGTNPSKEKSENEGAATISSMGTIAAVEEILRTVTANTYNSTVLGSTSAFLDNHLVASLLPAVANANFNVPAAQTVASNLIAGFVNSSGSDQKTLPATPSNNNENLTDDQKGMPPPPPPALSQNTDTETATSKLSQPVNATSFVPEAATQIPLNHANIQHSLSSITTKPPSSEETGGSEKADQVKNHNGEDSALLSTFNFTTEPSPSWMPTETNWSEYRPVEGIEGAATEATSKSNNKTTNSNTASSTSKTPFLQTPSSFNDSTLSPPSSNSDDVDETSGAQEEEKWQLIAHQVAPTLVGPARKNDSQLASGDTDESVTKSKNETREENESKEEVPASNTQAKVEEAMKPGSQLESGLDWNSESDSGASEMSEPVGDGSVLELDSASSGVATAGAAAAAAAAAVGLDSSTRGTNSDIVNFARFCNEIAFKFWMATNRGLSTARSLALSPFGMVSLLAMIFLGARGTTSEQMNEVLGLDNVASFNPHLIFQNVTDTVSLARLKEQGVANAAFVREIFADRLKVRKVMPFYKEQAQQFYEGLVAEVNFATISDLVRRRTNLLVRKQTGGRIKDLLRNNAVPLRSPLAAISANVFQTDCNSTAASSIGRDGELYFAISSSKNLRSRRLVPVPATVWRTTLLAGYEPSLDATAIALGTSDKLVSTIFLLPGQQGHLAPGDNLDRLEQRLITAAFQHGAWDKLLKVLVPRPGLQLQLPKFTHRSIVNATAALKRMGFQQLFSPQADFKGINGIGNHLFLSDVLQMNLFSTCGDESASNARHHTETYPASTASHTRDHRQKQNLMHHLTQQFGFTANTTTNNSSTTFQRNEPTIPPSLTFPSTLEFAHNNGKLEVSAKEEPRLKLDQPFLYFVRHNPTGMILHMGRFNPSFL